MTIIDVHTHAWPDAIAPRALAGTFQDLEIFGDGRVASLIAAMDEAGVDRAVCLAVANTGKQVDGANRFVASLDRDRFIGFGSIHPELSPERNVESLRANGLFAAKLHPLFQNYSLDDPSLLATLEAMAGEFIALIHVGGGNEHGKDRCSPAMLRAIVERFPTLDVIACHFGGFRMLDEADQEVIGLPVYLDTAWPPSVAEVDGERVRAIIDRHGAGRVLFGSDWPMASPRAELTALRALELEADTLAGILGENMRELLGRYDPQRPA